MLKKHVVIAEILQSNRTREVKEAKIRTVKVKAADLTHKLRRKVNLLIDAVNT